MLFKALSVFALREIDLTKIESRPMRDNPLVLSGDGEEGGQRQFNYMFYIDFVGSLAEPHVQNALRHLEVGKRGGAVFYTWAFKDLICNLMQHTSSTFKSASAGDCALLADSRQLPAVHGDVAETLTLYSTRMSRLMVYIVNTRTDIHCDWTLESNGRV